MLKAPISNYVIQLLPSVNGFYSFSTSLYIYLVVSCQCLGNKLVANKLRINCIVLIIIFVYFATLFSLVIGVVIAQKHHTFFNINLKQQTQFYWIQLKFGNLVLQSLAQTANNTESMYSVPCFFQIEFEYFMIKIRFFVIENKNIFLTIIRTHKNHKKIN